MLSRINLIVVGDAGVGKTSFVQRCRDKNETTLQDTVPTIGSDFCHMRVRIEGEQRVLLIWDMAGQERFDMVVASFYRDAHGALLVFDVTDQDSFSNIEKRWIAQINQHTVLSNMAEEGKPLGHLSCLLIGNKMDLITEDRPRVVGQEEAQKLAARFGMPYVEVSTKNNDYQTLTTPLWWLVKDIVNNQSSTGDETRVSTTIKLDSSISTQLTQSSQSRDSDSDGCCH